MLCDVINTVIFQDPFGNRCNAVAFCALINHRDAGDPNCAVLFPLHVVNQIRGAFDFAPVHPDERLFPRIVLRIEFFDFQLEVFRQAVPSGASADTPFHRVKITVRNPEIGVQEHIVGESSFLFFAFLSGQIRESGVERINQFFKRFIFHRTGIAAVVDGKIKFFRMKTVERDDRFTDGEVEERSPHRVAECGITRGFPFGGNPAEHAVFQDKRIGGCGKQLVVFTERFPHVVILGARGDRAGKKENPREMSEHAIPFRLN